MLKPIDPFQIKLPDFEGPLDLLLYLIEREELDVTKVSLAKVTGEYLEHIHLLEKLHVDQLADFLVIAAKLLLIKSQALLPRPPAAAPEGEEDVGDDLVRQLLLYKQYKAVAQTLGDREAAGLRTFVRLAPPPKIPAKLDLTGISIDDLLLAVRAALDVEKSAPLVGSVVKPFTLTIKDQMGLIERTLQRRSQISFRRMLADAQDRLEIIVTFLAILELLRRRRIQVLQDQLFGDIVIESSAEAEQPGETAEEADEESDYEIPKVAEEHPAEEFKFDPDSSEPAS